MMKSVYLGAAALLALVVAFVASRMIDTGTEGDVNLVVEQPGALDAPPVGDPLADAPVGTTGTATDGQAAE